MSTMTISKVSFARMLGGCVVACAWAHTSLAADPQPAPSDASGQVSYFTQIRPIFQARCHGCHQPAKPKGEYVMTSFDRLLVGGDTGDAAIIPERPDESYLIEMITPVNGEAAMPKGLDPLHDAEIELIRNWIAQGAVDDTPEGARKLYDAENPPDYTRLPVITSIDFSPDGELMAVAGFHEVRLFKADGSELVGRLVGLSERIESVRFSPDGKRLAVTGGLPNRMGELQIWNVGRKSLLLSVPVTYDTVYGASWSPDGEHIAFGCADNTVRAVNARTGEQILYQGAHNDWVLDTSFSADGSHLASVGRDGTAKLTEVATQRFVDNITSITPGALKGGIQAVARHPERDEIVIGGSDGVVKVYRMHRETKRVIGDDANQIRRMPPMQGRIFGVAVSHDGKRIAAGSSLDSAGQVHLYSYEFDTSLPDEIKKINEKVVTQQSAEEKATLEAYHTEGVNRVAATDLPESAVYAVAFRPDGKVVAAGGSDGTIRLIDAETGSIVESFPVAPLSAETALTSAGLSAERPEIATTLEPESLPEGAKLVGLSVQPESIKLATPFDYVQLLVIGRLDNGDSVDVTRMAAAQSEASAIVKVSPTGLVQPESDGSGTLQLIVGGTTVDVPVTVAGMHAAVKVDYVQHVTPVLSRMGCSSGICHGSANGRNGFKLSLRGYDAIFDVRALTDDHRARRVNPASPDDSLMLLKASSAVPHEGGQLTRPGEAYYSIIRSWIRSGAKLDTSSPRVVRVEIAPTNPIIQEIGRKQQFRVQATYADGTTRDVTRESFIESGNTEVVLAGEAGLMSALRRGEAPVLVRYEGAYAATTLTVMGDRTGFVWQDPPVHNRVDELVAAKWKKMKIQPSALCTDAEFIRRVHLDLTGVPPTGEQTRAFLADDRPTRIKRDELIDQLLSGPAYVDHWTNKWADLLQVNRKFLGAEGAAMFRDWIENEVVQGTPYDEFVRKIVTASGSNRENPAASYYKILRDPTEAMENTTHLFLAVRFNCNKCHDHPFERWTQDQYYQTAAYFARFDLKRDPSSGDRKIGGTAVEGAKPLFEVVYEKDEGEVIHDRTKQQAAPEFPFECNYDVPEDATRREKLAAWITSPDNAYFARSYVNRLWGYLFGVGIIEPIDDIRAGNPPSNPQLLAYLTDEFRRSGFDARYMLRLICQSRSYQLSFRTNRWNENDSINYSHAIPRRLPAEVLLDTVYRTTGAVSVFPGMRKGLRAAALPDAGVALPSRILDTLGRPPRESACECERSNELQLGSVMALISGPTIADAIADSNNAIATLESVVKDDAELVNRLYLRILNRPAKPEEIKNALAIVEAIDKDQRELKAALAERERVVKEIRPRLERAREEAIAAAKAELERYEKELAPILAEREREQAEKVAKLEAELAEYETTLPEKIAGWETEHASNVEWIPLRLENPMASNGVKLVLQPDRSVFADGDAGNSVYTLSASTDLRGIRAFRLEALADERLPQGGPGFAKDGNFVVTEFEIQAAAKTQPEASKKVELAKPLADFSQNDFAVAQAVDGKVNGRGWAVSPSFGVTHWATFETKEPIDHEGGTVLTFKLHQRFGDDKFRLGRFRISVSTTESSPGLSLPEELGSILATATADRTEGQQNVVTKYFRAVDAESQKRRQAVAEAKKPLPIDPGLKGRQDRLARVSQPIPEDAKLVQLQHDVKMSTEQLANKRLTAAQDLAWALINSPEFLFNH